MRAESRFPERASAPRERGEPGGRGYLREVEFVRGEREPEFFRAHCARRRRERLLDDGARLRGVHARARDEQSAYAVGREALRGRRRRRGLVAFDGGRRVAVAVEEKEAV